MDVFISLGSWIINNASYLVGVIMPPVVDYLNKDVHTPRERFLVSVFACFFAALLLHFKELYDNPENLLAATGIIFTESQIVFKRYFENSWVRWKLLSLYTEEETPPLG